MRDLGYLAVILASRTKRPEITVTTMIPRRGRKVSRYDVFACFPKLFFRPGKVTGPASCRNGILSRQIVKQNRCRLQTKDVPASMRVDGELQAGVSVSLRLGTASL